MKETVKTSRVAGYLEKMYRQLNADMFNNEFIEKAEREGFLEFDSDMMTVYYDGN